MFGYFTGGEQLPTDPFCRVRCRRWSALCWPALRSAAQWKELELQGLPV